LGHARFRGQAPACGRPSELFSQQSPVIRVALEPACVPASRRSRSYLPLSRATSPEPLRFGRAPALRVITHFISAPFPSANTALSAAQCFRLAADAGGLAGQCALLELPVSTSRWEGTFHGISLPKLELTRR
jgi:hypothetical protein